MDTTAEARSDRWDVLIAESGAPREAFGSRGSAYADFAGPDLAAALWSAAPADRVVADAVAAANGGRC